jgi:hypothetical protein
VLTPAQAKVKEKFWKSFIINTLLWFSLIVVDFFFTDSLITFTYLITSSIRF